VKMLELLKGNGDSVEGMSLETILHENMAMFKRPSARSTVYAEAQALHQAGLDVSMGLVLVDECKSLIALYTFPHAGNNGPTEENDTVTSRLNRLMWLAIYGNNLPAGVERMPTWMIFHCPTMTPICRLVWMWNPSGRAKVEVLHECY
jgi:hypothetical protein